MAVGVGDDNIDVGDVGEDGWDGVGSSGRGGRGGGRMVVRIDGVNRGEGSEYSVW